VIASTPS